MRLLLLGVGVALDLAGVCGLLVDAEVGLDLAGVCDLLVGAEVGLLACLVAALATLTLPLCVLVIFFLETPRLLSFLASLPETRPSLLALLTACCLLLADAFLLPIAQTS